MQRESKLRINNLNTKMMIASLLFIMIFGMFSGTVSSEKSTAYSTAVFTNMFPTPLSMDNSFWGGTSTSGTSAQTVAMGSVWDGLNTSGSGIHYNFDHLGQTSYLVAGNFNSHYWDFGYAGWALQGFGGSQNNPPAFYPHTTIYGTQIDSYYNYSAHYVFPPDSTKLISVKIIAVEQTIFRNPATHPSWYQFDPVWLSFGFSNGVPDLGIPWKTSGNPINWHNSSTFIGGGFGNHFIGEDIMVSDTNPCAFVWDVTTMENWTGAMVKSPNLYIMYTSPNFGFVLDYIGLQYTFMIQPSGFNPAPEYTGFTSYNGLIWILIMFIPAGMIGGGTLIFSRNGALIAFMVGLIAMLFIAWLANSSFLVFMIMGMIGGAIAIYRGVSLLNAGLFALTVGLLILIWTGTLPLISIVVIVAIFGGMLFVENGSGSGEM